MDICWYSSVNVNQSAKNIEMLRIMKKAGCVALGFGVEFVDDKVLKNIHKGSTTKLIRKALINAKKIGFPYIHIFLLQGMPGQNVLNTITAALRIISYRIILKDNKSYYGGFVQIYPGTDFEKISKQRGHFDEDFSWNTTHTFSIANKYSDSPNQQNKLSTVPIFIPESISLDRILVINKKMLFIERLIRRINKVLTGEIWTILKSKLAKKSPDTS